jgi:hypothetical protein
MNSNDIIKLILPKSEVIRVICDDALIYYH